MRAIYKKRRDVMVESSPRRDGRFRSPTASMFAWAPVPERFSALSSLEFSSLLIEKADLAVAPGVGFGEYGEGFLRLALVENEQRIRQAARNLRRFFDSADHQLHNVAPKVMSALTIRRRHLGFPRRARRRDPYEFLMRAARLAH